MAGTVSVAYQKHTSIKAAVIDWVSSSGGAADGEFEMDGELLRVVTNPDGSAAPTDNYDVVLTDRDGFDLAGGLLANRDTATTEEVNPFAQVTLSGTGSDAAAVRRVYAGTVTVGVTNAGDSKAGRITVYWR